MFDLYSLNSLASAAEKNLLKNNINKSDIESVREESMKYAKEDEYYLTPDRFAKNGWKL